MRGIGSNPESEQPVVIHFPGWFMAVISFTCLVVVLYLGLQAYQEYRIEMGVRSAIHALTNLLPNDASDVKPARLLPPTPYVWNHGTRFRLYRNEYIRTDMPDICDTPDPTLAGGFPEVCKLGK